jgi:hypothetical protein
VVEDGRTGFLVGTPGQAVQALGRLAEIDRRACRRRVEQRFSIASMVAAYEHVYATIFELEEGKRR